MKKLSNGIEYENPFFQEQFGEYLIENGFLVNYFQKTLFFYKGNKKLAVMKDNLDLFELEPQADKHKEGWQFTQSHIGAGKLDLFNFMMLMHVMKVVTIPEFMKHARTQNSQMATEAKFLIRSLVLHNLNV